MFLKSPHDTLPWFQIIYGWRVLDNRQCVFPSEGTSGILPAQRHATDSTFTVDFKGLQHPLCPGALRVQKETSELYINRTGLVDLNLYPHHEQHAKHHNKDHFKLPYIWVFCNLFEDVLWLNWLVLSPLVAALYFPAYWLAGWSRLSPKGCS